MHTRQSNHWNKVHTRVLRQAKAAAKMCDYFTMRSSPHSSQCLMAGSLDTLPSTKLRNQGKLLIPWLSYNTEVHQMFAWQIFFLSLEGQLIKSDNKAGFVLKIYSVFPVKILIDNPPGEQQRRAKRALVSPILPAPSRRSTCFLGFLDPRLAQSLFGHMHK